MASRIVTLSNFFTRLFSNSGLHSACMKGTFVVLLLALAGCGGSIQKQPQTQASPSVTPIPITFYGDSITAFWHLDQSFPGKPYTNDGTFGVTAETLESNFDMSVPPTHPGAVMILGGTNDVLLQDSAAHIFTTLTGIYDKARTDGIPFVVCTLPPMRNNVSIFNPLIVDLNNQLKAYAAENNLTVADYYSALVDPATGELRESFSLDNVHITDAGYAAIAPVAAKAIASLR